MNTISKFFICLIFAFCHVTYSIRKNNDNDEYHDFDEHHHTFIITGGYRPKNHTIVKYVVQLRDNSRNAHGDDCFCHGSIIAPKVILTAAHCLRAINTTSIMIVAGSVHRFRASSTTRRYKAKEAIIHEQYIKENRINDIGVIFTIKKIEMNEFTQLIGYSVEQPIIGSACTIAGWGRLYKNGPKPDEALYVQLYILPNKNCFKVPPTSFCAGDKTDYEKDSCSGDSGNALICNNTVQGIVSFGWGCANPRSGGIYVDVSQYTSWIMEQIKASCALDVFIFPKQFIIFVIFQLVHLFLYIIQNIIKLD